MLGGKYQPYNILLLSFLLTILIVYVNDLFPNCLLSRCIPEFISIHCFRDIISAIYLRCSLPECSKLDVIITRKSRHCINTT